MRLTAVLFDYLTRVYSRDPGGFKAFTIAHSNPMTWTVVDGRFKTAVPMTPADNLDLDLSAYTLTSLIAAIDAEPNYTAATLSAPDGDRGARILLDGTGTGGTDPVFGYRSLLRVYYEALAVELRDASTAVKQMMVEAKLDTARDEWLDLWQKALIVKPRRPAEGNAALRARIARTVLRIRVTNRALEQAVEDDTGLVVDIIEIPWLIPGNCIHTFGGFGWNDQQITNSEDARLPPAYEIDAAVLAHFGLVDLLPDGRPELPPSTGLPLQACMAVIFDAGADCTDQAKVLAVLEPLRAAGTVPVCFKPDGADFQLFTCP